MHVLVIGGTKFIGPHVVKRLEERHHVTVFHRGSACEISNHMHADRLTLREARRERFDVVVDMIAMTEADARCLIEADLAPRLVVISSADVYRQYDCLRGEASGGCDPLPLREDAPLRERFYPYRSRARDENDLLFHYDKVLVERTVSGPGTTILRLPAVYGPGDEQHRFGPWVEVMSRQSVLPIDKGQARWRWTRGYVENVADAIALAASDSEGGKTYNVGEPDSPPDKEWVQMVAKALGWKGRIKRQAEVPGTPPFNWDCDLVTDTTAIRRDLGYRERVSREEAVKATVKWELG